MRIVCRDSRGPGVGRGAKHDFEPRLVGQISDGRARRANLFRFDLSVEPERLVKVQLCTHALPRSWNRPGDEEPVLHDKSSTGVVPANLEVALLPILRRGELEFNVPRLV